MGLRMACRLVFWKSDIYLSKNCTLDFLMLDTKTIDRFNYTFT